MRDLIIAEARSWKGVRWRHQGRSERGIDCAGLVIMVAYKLGLAPIEANYTNYGREPDGSFVSHFREWMDEVPITKAEPGDVLIFHEHSHHCHSGILSVKNGAPALIHARASARKVIEEPMTQVHTILNRPYHAFKFRGID